MRHPGRHHGGFLLGAVEVVDVVDGLGFDVLQQAVGGQGLQARLRVPHRGRRIVVDRAEVAVPVDQGHPHGEVLGHAHQGVVDGRVAVGVVLTEHLPHHTGTFPVGPVAREAELVHRVEDAPVHRLEAVAGIGQGPAHDHAHRILQVGARHLIAQVGLDDPSVGFTGSGWIRHARPYGAQPTLSMTLPARSESALRQRQRKGVLRVRAAADFRRLVAEAGLAEAYAATDVVVAANAEFTDQGSLHLNIGPSDPPIRFRDAQLESFGAQSGGGGGDLVLPIGGGLGEAQRQGAPTCSTGCCGAGA